MEKIVLTTREIVQYVKSIDFFIEVDLDNKDVFIEAKEQFLDFIWIKD